MNILGNHFIVIFPVPVLGPVFHNKLNMENRIRPKFKKRKNIHWVLKELRIIKLILYQTGYYHAFHNYHKEDFAIASDD